MGEYIVDVGDADELHFAAFQKTAEFCCGYPVREEIVRCKDCVHYDDYLGSCLRGSDNGRSAVPDGFCRWGERKKQSELKPCPFCGGEAATRYEPYFGVYYVHCDTCGSETGNSGLYRKEDRAIEAWNTRAERTCDIEGTATDGLCTDDPKKLFHLSCGHHVMLCGLDRKPNYCAVCGAKVVSIVR